jgi:5-methylcytosine-specific restriction endonuclease McrA
LLLRELARRDRHSSRDELVRLAVRLRARDACEYCLLPNAGGFQLDHVIPPALWDRYLAREFRAVHPRSSDVTAEHLDNFAWSCSACNRAKGQQIEARVGRRTYRLFHPRRQRWSSHFILLHNYLFIVGLTGVGRATTAALRLNDSRLDGPLGPRHDAILAGRYPPSWARAWGSAVAEQHDS